MVRVHNLKPGDLRAIPCNEAAAGMIEAHTKLVTLHRQALENGAGVDEILPAVGLRQRDERQPMTDILFVPRMQNKIADVIDTDC